MSAYTPSYGLALEEPSEGRTAAKAFRDTFQSQSLQNPLRQSTTPKTEIGYTSPQAKTRVQSDYDSFSVKTSPPSYLEKSPYNNTYAPAPAVGNHLARTETSPARMLISEVDEILQRSQSPIRQQTDYTMKQTPSGYNQPTIQSYGVKPTAVSIVLNSERSQYQGDNTSSVAFKPNPVFVTESSYTKSQPLLRKTTSIEPQASYKKMDNTNLYPIKESPYVSHTSSEAPKSTGQGTYTNDLKSRLSELENQLNNIELQKSNTPSYKDPYYAPTNQSTQALPRETFAVPEPSSRLLQRAPSYGGPIKSISFNEKADYHPEANRLSNEIFNKVSNDLDDIIRKSTTSLPRSKNALYNSSTSLQAVNDEPYRPSTSTYNYQNTYDDRPTFGKNSTYVTPQKPESTYSTYEPLQKYDTRSSYEPVPIYESQYSNTTTPYASTYLPRYSDYDNNHQRTRPKYIRPLLRKSQGGSDFRSSLGASQVYTSVYGSPNYSTGHTKGANSISATPMRDNYQNNDNNSVDKKLKKLTLKSKQSEEKEVAGTEQPRYFPSKRSIRGAKRPNFKSGDLLSDYGSYEVEEASLPSMTFSDTYPQENKKSEPKNARTLQTYAPQRSETKNRLRTLNYKAGPLESDTEKDERRPASRLSQKFKSGELEHDEHDDYDYQPVQPVQQVQPSAQKTLKSTPTAVTAAASYEPLERKKTRTSNNYRAGDLEDDHDDYQTAQSNVHKTLKAAPSVGSSEPVERQNTRSSNKYRAGSLDSDHEVSSDNLHQHQTPKNYKAGELADDSESEPDFDREARERRQRMEEKAKARGREQEREKVREQERLRQQKELERIKNRISKNIPDDGKDWNMVFMVPSALFDGVDNSFHFSGIETNRGNRQNNEGQRQQVVRETKPAKTKDFAQSQQQQQPQKNTIWSPENPMMSSQRKSSSIYGGDSSYGRNQVKPSSNYYYNRPSSGFGY